MGAPARGSPLSKRAHCCRSRGEPAGKLSGEARYDEWWLGLKIFGASSVAVCQAARVLGCEVVSRVIAPRARLAIGRDRRNDERWESGGKLSEAQIVLLDP
jgi:hypothetical protein